MYPPLHDHTQSSLQKRELDDPEVSSALAGGLAGRSLSKLLTCQAYCSGCYTATFCAAGALTAVFVCPLDVLKTRLQVQGRAHAAAYKGIGGVSTYRRNASLQAGGAACSLQGMQLSASALCSLQVAYP